MTDEDSQEPGTDRPAAPSDPPTNPADVGRDRSPGVAKGPAATPAARGLVKKVLIATLVGALVFAALSLYGDVNALRANLSAFNWWMLVGALALATGNYALRFLRWQYYLTRIDVHLPYGESALIFLSGFVMSVTPGKVGEVFKALLIYEARGTAIARTAPVVVAERLTDLVALLLLTAMGALSFEQGVPITIAGAAVVAFLLAACMWRPLGELLLGIAARLPILRRAAGPLRVAYESLYAMTRPGTLLWTSALALGAWSLEVCALGLILRGFAGPEGVGASALGWEATTFAYAASTLAGALAMMPGGLGVTEAGMTGLLQTLSDGAIGPSVATAATMLVRLATLWWAVLIGALALWAFRHALAPARAVPRRRAPP